MKYYAIFFIASICLGGVVIADNLYHVSISSHNDALILRSIDVEPVIRTMAGYLILSKEPVGDELIELGLESQLIAESVTKNRLAIQNRPDFDNPYGLDLLFQEDEFRLYLLDSLKDGIDLFDTGLMPVKNDLMTIAYIPRETEIKGDLPDLADLEELISHVNRDSLVSYVEFFQRHGHRFFAAYECLGGTEYNVCDGSRDTLIDMLKSIGYESAVYDTFMAEIEVWEFPAHNVLAYKQGSLYPDQHIIIGAHRDCMFESPGANDNGSGAAALLEMARILKAYETDVTFVFILFDAEENNLDGSRYYAYNAAVRGDNIICMLNMDMIGHYENSVDARLYHGPDTTYCTLWRDLAEPLVGLTGFLWGMIANSDHFSFQQYGYPVLHLTEYIGSNVAHTELDSIKFMDFDYVKKMAQAMLATAYSISQSFEPDRSLLFEYTSGLPAVVNPFEPTTFEVNVGSVYIGVPVPNSGQLHYRINSGDYVVIPMVEMSSNHYLASLPALDCGNQLEFYISAEEDQGDQYSDVTPDNPHPVITATKTTLSFADDFELDLGWEVIGNALEGHWERGIPAGDGSRGDPTADYDGSGSCYLTGNDPGDSDVELGRTVLISPTFNAIGNNPLIHYARWLSNDRGPIKYKEGIEVSLSSDAGETWTIAEMIGPEAESSGFWYKSTLWLDDIIEPTANVKIRFYVNSSRDDLEIVEAGLDHFSVAFHECYICGDANSDNGVNIGDAVYLLTHIFGEGLGPGQYKAADTNCDGAVNIGDAVYLINFIFRAEAPDPCALCPQS